MTEGNFVDYVKIYVSPEREEKDLRICIEKFIEKGGPDGGDGGRGGHVYLVGNKGLWTLFHLKFASHQSNGGDGSGDRSTGADGDDKFIEVPLGTVVKDKETVKYYLKLPKMVKTNSISRWKRRFYWHFRSSTNQTPRYSQPGLPGVEMDVILELKFWLM
jgi:GTP-binding protein